MGRKPALRDAALARGAARLETRPGWFTTLRKCDPESYRQVYELVRDYEAHDPELRSRFPSRAKLFSWFLREQLEQLGIQIKQSAFEHFARQVRDGDGNVKP